MPYPKLAIACVCAECGTSFTRPPSEIRKGGGKFCGRVCRQVFDSKRMNSAQALEARLWEKVKKNGPVPEHRPELGPCWVWTGARRSGGYGVLRIGRSSVPAHQLAFESRFGDMPKGMVCCHFCDNPPCCNPSHLFAGTMKDNSRDMIAKGRGGKTRLTDDHIKRIFDLRDAGLTAAQISEDVGCHRAHIGKVLRGDARNLSAQSRAKSPEFHH